MVHLHLLLKRQDHGRRNSTISRNDLKSRLGYKENDHGLIVLCNVFYNQTGIRANIHTCIIKLFMVLFLPRQNW